MPSLDLSPPVFSILSSLIEEKSGLHYGLLDRESLQDKASQRALDAGFDSLLDYYYYLRYDAQGAAELKSLVECLVVHETYFFREWAAVEALVEHFIAPWCAAGRRPRIWSAACSSGEEPLSLAMALEARSLLSSVDLVASDISTRVLAKPQKGRYGPRSVRQVPRPDLLNRFLSSIGSEYQVDTALVKKVAWTRLNLQEDSDFMRMGKFDAILCRNVLIYFSDATVKSVLNRLSGALKEDGVLLVGVSESLMRYGSGLVGEERSGTFLYRKARSQ